MTGGMSKQEEGDLNLEFTWHPSFASGYWVTLGKWLNPTELLQLPL